MYSTLEILVEDTTEEISKYINLDQIIHLSSVSKEVNRLFYQSLQKCKKQIFFEYVKTANYPMVEKFLDKEPTLLFTCNFLKSYSQSIRPIAYAFMLSDPFMLEIFKKNIEIKCTKENKQTVALLQASPPNHVDLTPLFCAYEHYISSCKALAAHKISTNELNQEWLKLGKAQREYMPRVMLKLYCSSEIKNTKEMTFLKQPNEVPQVYDYYNGQRVKVPLDITQLGEGFALYHTANGVYAIGIKGSMTPPRNSDAIQSELTALKSLYAEMTQSSDKLLAHFFQDESINILKI